ncbi:Ig-like domain-containing protein [Mucilaginibacter agri]|uniref:SbsA Ig-like domain-containing protein n=1 Tax=Mucilaginibacter agri TaxID=2695265 RepID=A0A966DWD9_9SPHI|nr:Ig-like domain-containing protein [Mucilaginibacter agri]NCD72412.1 hypothetical protein [Mucilaginibacter agri]
MKIRYFLIAAIALFILLNIQLAFNFLMFGKANAKSVPDAKATSNDFVIIKHPLFETIKVRFQDSASATPVGWIKDYGSPFGEKLGLFEIGALDYGWKSHDTHLPVDISMNSRTRENPDDLLLEGLVHMQANDISWWRGLFNGTKTEAYWEMKVLNGYYDVVVTVGDGAVGKAEELYCINIEGVNAINKFKPFGKVGSLGRFKTIKKRVKVTDGYLTIDANNGINTKINNIQITPVKLFPYLFLSTAAQSILVKKIDTADTRLKINLTNLLKSNTNYKLHLNYGPGAKGWLNLVANRDTAVHSLSFDYAPLKKLKPGEYNVTVSILAAGYQSNTMPLRFRVVDPGKPYVVSSNPIDGNTDIEVNTTNIAANNLFVPVVNGVKGGIDNHTITNKSVKLFKDVNNRYVPVMGVVQGTGGGDAISFSPREPLMPFTKYRFVITNGVKSYAGASIEPYNCDFVTGSVPADSSLSYDVHFQKIPMPGTQRKNYTALKFGPDGKFYALRMDGMIERYEVNHETGMLSGQKLISTLKDRYGERTAIGFAFDPSSTPQNLIAWVSHSSAGITNAPMYDGNISKLTGIDLSNEQLIIKDLPHSTRDHMVNGIAFGPDSALYICQGSNSSAGAFDKSWQREETLLAGSILRLELQKLRTVSLPLDVKTSQAIAVINHAPANQVFNADGTYNPYSHKSPLTIYASGIRNAYGLLWHSNGQLYVPANGSGGGGNSPASVAGTRRPDGTFYNGPAIPATTGVQVQHDWLFRINPKLKVGYFGHPNPLRGEYVINRGFTDNPLYDKDVKPDANYRGAAFDFGLNHSPNGVIEYKSNNFDGVLKGRLLVCRFSGGGDIIVLEPGEMGNGNKAASAKSDHVFDIVKSSRGSDNLGLVGMSGFANPLDIIEDPINGNLYISEFNWNDNPNLISQITLLKAVEKKPKVQFNASAR